MTESNYNQIKGEVRGSVWGEDQPFTSNDFICFKTKTDRCKILQLTDIHLRQYTKNTFGTAWKIHRMIRKENPDLVVVTGDFTALKNNKWDTKWLVRTLDHAKTPWTAIMGNHDSQGQYDRYYIANILENSKYGLFRQGPKNIGGVGNFILSLTTEAGLWGALFFLDSHTSFEINGLRYQSLTRDQISWYRWAVNGMDSLYKKDGGCADTIPSLMFLHIPLNEFQDAWEKGRVILGKMGEDKVYAPEENSGMFSEIVRLKSTKGVFAGHDHASTFCCEYQGVVLGYGTHTRFNKKDKAEKRFTGSVIIMDGDGKLTLKQTGYRKAVE